MYTLTLNSLFPSGPQNSLFPSVSVSDKTFISIILWFITLQTIMLSRALDCLTENLDRIQDSYTVSLVTYTLMLADHPKAEIMMDRLRNNAITLKGVTWVKLIKMILNVLCFSKMDYLTN